MRILKYLVLFIIVLFLGFFLYLGISLSPGSYVYSEDYTINKTESETIVMINQLKESRPEFIAPPTIWAGIPYNYEDGKDSHWYYTYIYMKEEDRIIQFYIRGDYFPTVIGLFAATTKNDLTNWKKINKDLDDEENEKVIKWFEANILKKLEERGAKVEKDTFFRRYFLN